MKKIISFCLSMTLVGALLVSTTPAFAKEVQSTKTSVSSLIGFKNGSKPKYSVNLVGTPSYYEYQYEYAYLNKTNLTNLKAVADRAYASNTPANCLTVVATMLTYISGGTAAHWCQVLTGVSAAMTSDLDTYGTVSFCYDAYVYLDTHTQYRTVYTKFKEKRFWTGDHYSSDWHPIDKPINYGYAYN